MKIELLVLHRRDSYPGENAPEILGVADEWTLDENPEWWPSEIARLKEDHSEPGDGSVFAVVQAELDQDQLMKLLYPENPIELFNLQPVQR